MVQRDPFTVLAQMDRQFDELVRRGWGAARQVGSTGPMAGFVPAVEVVQDGEDVVVRVELPGVDVERDVAIEVERGKLVISGERRDTRSEHEDGEGAGAGEHGPRLLVRELRYGQFRREFSLPPGISPEQVSASYDAGLLDVRVRGVVKPEPQPVRVPISTGRETEQRATEQRVIEHDGEAAQA